MESDNYLITSFGVRPMKEASIISGREAVVCVLCRWVVLKISPTQITLLAIDKTRRDWMEGGQRHLGELELLIYKDKGESTQNIRET
jgi:hypothetical protein